MSLVHLKGTSRSCCFQSHVGDGVTMRCGMMVQVASQGITTDFEKLFRCSVRDRSFLTMTMYFDAKKSDSII